MSPIFVTKGAYFMNTTIYASDYAKLDSNVLTGGGTDETEILQGLLDKALEWGRVKLIMDGAALVRGLKVHSNTTIECQDKDCGFYLADGSDCAVLCNSNMGFSNGIQTRNVTLIGGTYNHNCLHQAHHVMTDNPDATFINMPEAYQWTTVKHNTVAMEFIGIENLNVRDLTIRDQRTYAFTVGNFRHVNIENTYIELDHELPLENQDGFHFWGPGQFLTIRNIGGKTEDDFMNICPDERDGVSSITDVLIDGVFLDHAWQGIRLLSRGTGILDRVTIRNVTGTYNCFGFYINPWFEGATMGNFGNITFENIDLRPEWNEGFPDIYKCHSPFLFSIGGDMENMTFRNINWQNPVGNWNIFQIGVPYGEFGKKLPVQPRIRNFLIDGMRIAESDNPPAQTDYLKVRGIVDRLTLRDVTVTGAHPTSKLLKLQPDGQIRRLTLDRVDAENMDCLLELEGKTDVAILHDLIETNIAETIRTPGDTKILDVSHHKL